MTQAKTPRVALQFGDGPNDSRGRGRQFGMYDNGVWENVLGIPNTPNAGPRNQKGFRSAAEFGGWCIENAVDVLIWTLWLGGPPIAEVKKVARDTKFVGLVDHPLNVDLLMSAPAGPRGSVPYVKNIADFDAVMVLTPRELGFYSGIHTNVHHVGLPFPHEGYAHLRVPRAPFVPHKPKVRIGLGVGGPGWAWWDRNYVATAFAYRAIHQSLEKAGIACEGVWLSVGYEEKCPIMPLLKGTLGTTIQVRKDMETYLATLQSCDIVISNIMRDTPGRLVAECAYFGVPCVGSNSLALQGELFPSLSHDPWDIRSTVETVIEIVSDGIPPGILENAAAALHEYDFDRSREKFLGVLESMGFARAYLPAEKAASPA